MRYKQMAHTAHRYTRQRERTSEQYERYERRSARLGSGAGLPGEQIGMSVLGVFSAAGLVSAARKRGVSVRSLLLRIETRRQPHGFTSPHSLTHRLVSTHTHIHTVLSRISIVHVSHRTPTPHRPPDTYYMSTSTETAMTLSQSMDSVAEEEVSVTRERTNFFGVVSARESALAPSATITGAVEHRDKVY